MRSLLTLVAAVFLVSLFAPVSHAAPVDAALAFQMHWNLIESLDDHPWETDPPRKGANDPIDRLAPIHLDEHPWIGPPGKGANDPIERLAPIHLDEYPWGEDPSKQGANKPQT